MAITWTRFSGAPRSVQGVSSALTESAPSSATDGIDLAGVRSIRVTLAAPSGQTFDGTGTLLGYTYSRYLEAWTRTPEADLDLTDANGLERVTFPPIEVLHPHGRFAHVPSGVGVSGGTSLTETLEAAGPLRNSEL